MSGSNRFYTDTSALRERARLNASGGETDLEPWIIGHIAPLAGRRVLDLGCGTGKQVFALANLVLPQGTILGADISPDAVAEVRSRAARENLSHIQAVQSNLDDCPGLLAGQKFDLILSTYAIYYSRDTVSLLKELRQLLAPDGHMFICGYAAGSNHEMIDLQNSLARSNGAFAEPIDDFLSQTDLERLGEGFGQVEVSRLNNRVKFESATALLTWWRNHKSYEPSLDAAVEAEVEALFNKSDVFWMTKNVLGVLLRV